MTGQDIICRICGNGNQPDARFCAHCGRRFSATRKSCGSCGTAGVAVLVLVGCVVALSTTGWFSRSKPMLRVGLDLADDKSATMYALLAPDCIPIIIGKADAGLWVKGTHEQIDAVRAFVSLISRYDQLPEDEAARIVEGHRPGWTTARTYRVPSKLRDPLFDILAFDDVDVAVYREGRRIGVHARPDDQAIIERFVDAITG